MLSLDKIVDRSISPQDKLDDLESWLKTEDEPLLEQLFELADQTRHANVGDQVHLRGLIEISNHCVRSCHYCGLNLGNKDLYRYRMEQAEILSCAHLAKSLGYGTVVIQSGEDPGFTTDTISSLVRTIKDQTGLAITLSLGERSPKELAVWKEAGADRYLLRFETSDRALYSHLHPPLGNKTLDRFFLLKEIKKLKFEVGSGVMIGLPYQTFSSLAKDLVLFAEMDLDMIGVGPFIKHPNSALGSFEPQDSNHFVPNSELMTYKVLALTRLMCPEANMPATTALATLNPTNGRELALSRGANVVMPNLTPTKYRESYEIYPNKACVSETAEMCNSCLRRRLTTINRTVGSGAGGRIRNNKDD